MNVGCPALSSHHRAGQVDSDCPDVPGNTHRGVTLKSNALSALPNATQAEFWLQRAHSHHDKGNFQVMNPSKSSGLDSGLAQSHDSSFK